MTRQLKMAYGMVLLVLLTLLSTGTALRASAQSQGKSPTEVAQALADAQNANDASAMRALIAPDAIFVNDPDLQGSSEGREQWIADNTGAHNTHVTATNVRQTAPDTVTADAVLTGGDLPAQLPHPFLVHVTFTIVNGQITHAVIFTDAQTRKDLQAMGPPPGMPKTGQPAGWLLLAVIAMAAFGMALAGLTLRLRSKTR